MIPRRRRTVYAWDRLLAGGGGPVPPSYTPNSVAFDGSAAYLSDSSFGLADNALGRIALRTRIDGGDGSAKYWLANSINRLLLFRHSSGGVADSRIWLQLLNASATKAYYIKTSAQYLASGSWISIYAAWNTNAAAGAKSGCLVVNGVNQTEVFADTDTAFSVGYAAHGGSGATTAWGFAASTAGANKFPMSEAGVYFDVGVAYEDPLTGYARFFNSNGTRKNDWTGIGSPVLLLNNAAATVGNNAGSGGNMTINGTPTDTTGG